MIPFCKLNDKKIKKKSIANHNHPPTKMSQKMSAISEVSCFSVTRKNLFKVNVICVKNIDQTNKNLLTQSADGVFFKSRLRKTRFACRRKIQCLVTR